MTQKEKLNLIAGIIAIILLMLLCLTFTGCSTTKYVPVESVRTDSIYMTLLQHDSIYTRDSIYIKEKGDTIYEYRYKYMFVDKAVHDTTYIERVDSIQVPYPVEKDLSKWQQVKMDVGGIAIGVIAVAVIAIIIYLIIYKREKE